MKIKRRTALAGLGAFSAAAIFPQFSASQTEPRKRHDLRTPEGDAMLRIYAEGVKAMQALLPSDVKSWTFQFYTHWVKGGLAKGDELTKYFGAGPNPARDLAEAMWSSCQAHGGLGPQSNFLPWHRAYVLCFEDIVRAVTGKEQFTLPYWDYIDDPVLPLAFRSESDPVFKYLYFDKRLSNAQNGGTLLDLNHNALTASAFSGSLGFSSQVDGNPHGQLHMDVGKPEGMGNFRFAANDPVFWVHHCNIDRLWAAWNALKRENPTDDGWGKIAHIFADRHGVKATFENAQMTDIAPLGYSYDILPKPPKRSVIMAAGASSSLLAVARSSGPIRIGGERSTVSLEVTNSDALAVIQTLGDARRQFFLVIGDLSASVSPEASFRVFARPRGDVIEGEGIYVGTINFFNARIGEEESGPGTDFAFPLAPAAIEAGVTPESVDALQYAIVPSAPVAEGSVPTIGRVELLLETFPEGVLQ